MSFLERVPEYLRWLLAVSLCFAVFERLLPQRPAQAMLRRGWLSDLCYLLFNGHFYSLLTSGLSAGFAAWFHAHFAAGIGLPARPLLDGAGFWTEFVVVLVAADFVQWCVHNLLHRVPMLWHFHQVHHSIKTMDWAGNFRYHWMENVVYKTLLFLPMSLLGGGPALMAVAVFGTVWGHFNHSNLRVGLGPLALVFNSPRMHLWHHDRSDEGGVAKNFGIVFSLWDFLFRTAYWPRSRPPEILGFPGDERMPREFWTQWAWPFLRRPPERPPQDSS